MSRLVKVMLTSLIILLLLVIIALVVFYKQKDDVINHIDDVPINKMDQYSYQTPEITTDLKDGSFVRIQFQLVTNSKQAQKEIVHREFQLKNILIKELAKMEEDDFKANLAQLENVLVDKINEVMEKGQVLKVFTTNKILQN